MKKMVSVAMLAASLLLSMPPRDAAACGDKFLVIGRATQRVQRAKNPASILLAVNPQGSGAAAVRAMKLEATLKQAGHTVETMQAAVLATWLSTHRYDFVVTDLEAAAPAVRDASASPSKPSVIPVAVEAPDAARKAAEKAYVVVIPAPSRSVGYLRAIDTAMGARRSVAPH
jgi:hypothetical protein